MILLAFLILININTATLQQLDQITEIGPITAQRIIDARPYSSINGLLKVKGIGEKTLQKIKEQGIACVGCVDSSLRGGQQSDAAIPILDKIASSPEAPRNDAPTGYPAGIFINEILPSPQGADEQEEYLELQNANNFDVDLSGWQIQDTAGTITIFTIPQNTKILTNSFLVFKRPETKIMLNNGQDSLNLLTPDKKIIDSASFASAPLGQSYNKTLSGWVWSAALTPGSKNIVTMIAKTPSTSSKPNGLPKSQKFDNNKIELATAGLNNVINTNQTSPWALFFTALAIAVISAIAILFIKIKFNNNVRT
ncbi:MAG: hypothetical protein A2528_00040 [Candidatus Staskawiczbacteria bacterium RIFOXYD2_FULL_37_9]|uniref:LTD domain-containing protein n=1 Tax=Candidatus Staskawiczbacteria bacterium RIFOXYB1_FULL_37_44 TaxID=1802223 RepID=A0A1G2IU57_9BACT|nr:MAG: hypothetical protein A2358_02685 [Candidatus Staskawiczbacteria bacterium RIFOXYB1_FULL_37_44]OGZ84405.1 MAG: hypothetical protein A2416_01620 [Candidatus Staskawiczbacteria bacterium RIFOXYC1_FULL_37_52]OGZ88161.1 MAG: hypothetical protein A2444_01625 [Candidatus Staskawiczbacteria bacterium RIFOXYC2_FULL_37_19]OGZ89829.1 MAG: hypothetical protein A2581_03610 [Candidatus Staskawiczbacteria bacterium RIFOXYD1_FULL_37_110]OGZ94560.1 MAG: hypothetical protein A2528_00040 [Candidatus Stask